MTVPGPLKPAFRPAPRGYPVLVSEPTYTDGGSQQTDKHGPLLDEELQHETRGLVQGGRSSRAEEWRDPEPAGEDQPTGDRIYPEDRRGEPAGVAQTGGDERAGKAPSPGPSAFPRPRGGPRAGAPQSPAAPHAAPRRRSRP